MRCSLGVRRLKGRQGKHRVHVGHKLPYLGCDATPVGWKRDAMVTELKQRSEHEVSGSVKREVKGQKSCGAADVGPRHTGMHM